MATEEDRLEGLYHVLYDLRWHLRGTDDATVHAWLLSALDALPHISPEALSSLLLRVDGMNLLLLLLLE